LRRRLSAEGTSFQQLLDELRREQALAHVANDQLSLEQLADTLGFLDMSTFHRAFKRWTGQTPGRYREQQKRK
jgi:AraC-like DNA-binding protein